MEPEYLHEHGIFYFHVRPRIKLHLCDRVFTYRWFHKPSGKTGTDQVVVADWRHQRFIGREQAFTDLLHHWNRTEEWVYTPEGS